MTQSKVIKRRKMKVPKRHRALKIPRSWCVFTVRLTLPPDLAETFEQMADTAEMSASFLLSSIVAEEIRKRKAQI